MDADGNFKAEGNFEGCEMKENRDFCTFVKERLEDEILGEVPPRIDEIVRIAEQESFARIAKSHLRCCWVASLVAASFAVAFVLTALLPSHKSIDMAACVKPTDTVAGVIDILCMANGMELDVGDPSIVEKLLSWQDAPYESAIADM